MSTTSPPFPTGPNYGPMYMAMLLCVGLWGVSCMQTFLYFLRYPNDEISLKFLVFSVWLLDTTHQVLVVKGVYTYLVSQFGNYQGLIDIVPEIIWAPLFTTIVGLLTQAFFVYRIWRFGKNILALPVFWALAAAYQLASCLVYVSKGTHASSALVLTDSLFTPLTISYFGTAAIVDVMIAACLTYKLLRDRSVGTKRYEKMLQRLAIFSINSGAWTAIFSLLALALFAALPSNLIYVVFDFPLCSLYCNTLLANLNVRSHVRSLAPADKGDLVLFSTVTGTDQIESEVRTIVIGRPVTDSRIYRGPVACDALSTTNATIHDKC
ncbi:hypothetical protein BV22DRAFT_820024 [Leucogyrophana mollusca]|uniref:Uncharacterized protein n=1 Tax=Leucogyrophana mollusca TaxID=85980 RepID=A0ACB8B326_9AGAM|nr:hypothetical protein BV22DRAFT_820024 [Leucogyrophana mollusca]